ncbi:MULTISPECIES: phage tail protein [Sinorhizobium]|uniref:phage tail protein n=1 Tax=Rhizobium meliloti TaxID=382 RepID=UPI001F28EF41|nr:phage tail protein [Sinorhizobium meliloti]
MRIQRFLVLLAVFCLSADSAFAGPVAAAISAVAGLLSAGGFAASVLKLAIGFALQYGVSLIEKARAKKREGAVEARGVTIEVRMGDDQPASFVVGTYATAGIRKYIGTWGEAGNTPNAYLTDVVELSCIPHPGLSGIWIDDSKGTILWNEPHADGRGYPIQEFRVDGKDFAWVRFVDGKQTVADPWLIERFGSHPERPFKATMIGRGIAYAVVTFRYNTEKFGGLPTCLFEMLPMPLYDLRKDSTNGGSGAQRWNDPSTWEPSDNNVVVKYNVIRGIYYGGEWVFGGQNLAAFRLPASNWIAGANECDRLVDRAGGGQEKQFRCGYEIRLDMEPLSVVDDLRQGCNARLAEVGGVFKTLVGAPGAAVYSFTDDDILVTEDQSFEPFPALSETHNGIEATYPEPSEKWATKDAPARYSSTLEADDGNRRLVIGVEFPAVPFGRQVQTLMKAMIEEERRFRTHLFHLPPDAFPLEPNDAVSWTSLRNGYVNKKFLVVRVLGKLTFNQLVVLKEFDPSDYNWSGTDELPTDIGWLGPIEPPAQPMYGWQVIPANLLDDAGNPRRPSMRVSCDPDQDDVRQVHVQVRLKASAAVVFDGIIAYGAPHSWILNGTFLPATTYQARGKFIPFSTRKTDWGAWLDVTTDNIRLNEDDVYLPGVIEELQEFTNDATDWLRDGVRDLIIEQQRMARLIAEQDLASFSDKQTLRRELVSRSGDITASYTEAIVAATGPGSALVGRLVTLEAKIPTLATVTALDALTASVTQQGNTITAYGLRIDSLEVEMPGKASVSAVNSLDTRVTNNEGTISAQANSISSLFAALGGNSAAVNIRASVLATPTGYAARYGIEARTGGAGTYRSAAMYLDVPASTSSPTRVVFLADQFVIASGSNLKNPFIFQNGEATLNVANIGTVNTGLLQSPNGKMKIDVNNGTIEVFS